MLDTVRPDGLSLAAQSARGTPPVLQTSAAIDFSSRMISMSVDLNMRHVRRSSFDWLLRLDLASSPPSHEQWHGQAACVGGHVEVDVRPEHWPEDAERWLLNLWMRDPNGRSDWDLIDTRYLT